MMPHPRFTRPIVLVWFLSAAAAIAADPTESQPTGPAHWNLEQLGNPPQFTDAPISEPGVRGIFYDGLPLAGNPTRVFAWLGLPKNASTGKVPAMVLVHGGGGTAHAHWVSPVE